jgi:hypothetical protein
MYADTIKLEYVTTYETNTHNYFQKSDVNNIIHES